MSYADSPLHAEQRRILGLPEAARIDASHTRRVGMGRVHIGHFADCDAMVYHDAIPCSCGADGYNAAIDAVLGGGA